MKVSKSIVLGLSVLFVGTACSKQSSNFSSSKPKSRVINTDADAEKVSKQLDDIPGFDDIYASETEKYLNTPMDEALDSAVAQIEKAFGNEPATINGVDYEDPAGRMNEVAELIRDSSFDPYATIGEIREDLELPVELTDRKAVAQYLADEKDTLQDFRDTLAEIDPSTFVITGPEGSSESEETLSLVNMTGTAVASGNLCVSYGIGCPAVTVDVKVGAAQSNAKKVAPTTLPPAQSTSDALSGGTQNPYGTPVNQATLSAQSQTLARGFPASYAKATEHIGMYQAGIQYSTNLSTNADFAASQSAGKGGPAVYTAQVDQSVDATADLAAASVVEMWGSLGVYFTKK